MPILNRVALAGICLLPLSCGAILEEMKLEDQTQITPQQDLDLKFQALTFAADYDLNMMPFERLVERAGSGQAARIVDEHDITHGTVSAAPNLSPTTLVSAMCCSCPFTSPNAHSSRRNQLALAARG